MKRTEIAICDCLRHPQLGIISNQPDLMAGSPGDETIRVRDRKGKVFFVQTEDCERASREEADTYWLEFNIYFRQMELEEEGK